MSDVSEDFVVREKRKHNKKTNWEKSDKISHHRKTALKRRLDEIAEDDDEWEEYKKR